MWILREGSPLEWLVALAGTLAAIASLIGSLVTAGVAWMGYQTSRLTHRLQLEVEMQRQAQAQAAQLEQERREATVRQAHEESEREMRRIASISDEFAAHMIEDHAWFKFEPVDRLGKRWRLVNIGTRAAAMLSVEEYIESPIASLGIQLPVAEWIEPSRAWELQLPPYITAPITFLFKVEWQEWNDIGETAFSGHQYVLLDTSELNPDH